MKPGPARRNRAFPGGSREEGIAGVTSGGSEETDVIVIDSFTVVVRRNRDGGYASEVTNLPGCGAEAPSVDELIEKTRGAIASFLSGGSEP
jgi:hypothetical protein